MLWVIFWLLVVSSVSLIGLVFSSNPLVSGARKSPTLLDRIMVLLAVPAMLGVTAILYLTSSITEGRFPSWQEVVYALSDIYDLVREALRPE
ncbi:MAG: hypothetical protein AB1698_01625 [Pseudomonadota bacterium]